MEYWIIDYYEKECRYFVKSFDKFEKNITSTVRNILDNL